MQAAQSTGTGCKIVYEDVDRVEQETVMSHGQEVSMEEGDISVLRRITAHGHMQACVSIPKFDRSRLCSDTFDGELSVSQANVSCECKPGYKPIATPGQGTVECVPENMTAVLESMPLRDAEKRLARARSELEDKQKLAQDLTQEVEQLGKELEQTSEKVIVGKEREQVRQRVALEDERVQQARTAVIASIVIALLSLISLSVFAVRLAR